MFAVYFFPKILGKFMLPSSVSTESDLFQKCFLDCKLKKTLSANPIKWSNTYKQFVGKSRRIV